MTHSLPNKYSIYEEGGNGKKTISIVYSVRHNQDLAEELWKKAEAGSSEGTKYIQVTMFEQEKQW